MSRENIFLSPSLNKNCELPKNYDHRANSGELLKTGSEDGDRMRKNRENFIRRKELERINRMHLKRGGSASTPGKVPVEGQNQRILPMLQNQQKPLPLNDSAEEETERSKSKENNPYEIIPSSGFKKPNSKLNEVEKIPDAKTKKLPLKTKVITAFGTTIRKAELEPCQFTRKKTKFAADRFGKSKRVKSKVAILEECGDEPLKDQSQPELPEKGFSTNVTLSKNKLPVLPDDGEKEKKTRKGISEISVDKRSHSPKGFLSQTETNEQASRGCIESETRRKEDIRIELREDFSLLEKIQHNLRAYFNPKPVEVMKFDCGEKKVKEGENPDNDESVMIWKDERIERGIKEDFAKGDQSFFVSIESAKEFLLEKIYFKRNRGSREVTNGYLPGEISERGIGSGPGGKTSYSYRNKYPYNRNSDYHCKSLFYIKKNNEFKEKPRTRSFHRSKTLQKNALASSPPEVATSIDFILESDQQFENLYSADGMVSAITQIQELHQEINPGTIPASVSCTGGFASTNPQEDSLKYLPNYLPGDSLRVPMKEQHLLMRTPLQTTRFERINLRTKRPKKKEIYSRKSTADIYLPYESHPKISKSERIHFHSDFPVRSFISEKEIHMLPFRENIFHPTQKHEKQNPPERFNYSLFVYTVTETKSIRPPDRKWFNKSFPKGQEMTRQKREELEKEKRIPMKYSETTRKIEGESSPLTLKNLIGLSRKTFHLNPISGEANPRCSAFAVEDLARPGRAITLGQYLEKLMEEKKNYLNLEKTKKFRREQKANFVADSFNFFNLLNREFLTVKSSNPKIEMLRNVIVERKEPKMEDYLDMYRKVIRTSLTEPEQYLMNEAKQELEKYTDMYYDLMKCICLENEEKDGGNSNVKNIRRVRRDSVKINRSDLFKSVDKKNNEDIKSSDFWNNYLDRTRPNKPEKSYYVDRKKEIRKNHGLDTCKKCNSNENPGRGEMAVVECRSDGKMPKKKDELVSELFNTQTDKKMSPANESKENLMEQGKLLLTISICDDGLIIKQAKDIPREEVKKRDKTRLPSPIAVVEKPLVHLSRTDPVDFSSNSSGIRKKSSASLAKAFSNATPNRKTSLIEEDNVEDPMKQHLFMFKTSQKLASDGLHHLGSCNDADLFVKNECTTARKGKKALEPSKLKPVVPKAVEKERKKVTVERKTGTGKVLVKRNKEADQSSRTIKHQRIKPLCRRSCGSGKWSISPKKKEESTMKRPWWHAEEKFATEDMGMNLPHKFYDSQKPEKGLGNRMCLLSEGSDKSGSLEMGGKLDKESELNETEEEGGAKEEKVEETLESNSDFVTPPGSYFEWRFGMKNLKDILHNVPNKIPSKGGLSEGKLSCTNEEKEEQEIIKMDFVGSDDDAEESSKKVSSSCSECSKNSLKHSSDGPVETNRERLVDVSSQRNCNDVGEALNQFMEKISEAWKTATCLKDLMELGKTRRSKSPEPKQANDSPTIERIKWDENKRNQQSDESKVVESFRNFLHILTTVFEEGPSRKVVREQVSILAKEFLKSSSDLRSPLTPEQGNATANDIETHLAKGISQISCEIKGMVTSELASSGINLGETKTFEPADFITGINKVGESLKGIYATNNDSELGNERSQRKIKYQSPKSKVDLKPKKIYYRPAKTFLREDSHGKTLNKSNLPLLAEKIRQIYKEEQSRDHFINEKSILKNNTCLNKQSSIYFDALENVQELGESARKMAHPGPISFPSNVNSYEKVQVFDKIIEFLMSDNPVVINLGVALLDGIADKDENFDEKNEKETPEDKDQPEKKWYDLLDNLVDTCRVIETEMIERLEKRTRTEPENSEKRKGAEKASEHLKIYVKKIKSLIKEIKLSENDFYSSVERIRALGNSRETNMKRQLIEPQENATYKRNYFLSDTASCIDDTFRNNDCPLGQYPDLLARRFPDNSSPDTDSAPLNFVIPERNRSKSISENNKIIIESLRQNIEKRQRKIMTFVDQVGKKKGTEEENLYREKITKKVRDLKKCYHLLVKLICDPTLSPPKWLDCIGTDFKEPADNRKTSAMALLENLMVRAANESEKNRIDLQSRHNEGSRSESKTKEESINRINSIPQDL